MAVTTTGKAPRVGSRSRSVALITGVAEGLGASIARTLGEAGYDVIGLARSERVKAHLSELIAEVGGAYTHIACDVTDAARLSAQLAPMTQSVEVAVHNAHHLLIKPFEEITSDDFERVWRVACLGAMAVSQIVLPHMAARGSGTIIFTGATASRRGAAKFSAFASAKFALRGLAQSLAREYGPKGVHVAHVIIDGLIWEPQTVQRFSARQSACLEPEAIAAAYLAIIKQHRSAWTHELDLRPFSERF